MTRRRTAFKCVVLAMLLFAAIVSLLVSTGCKRSETIRQVVYTQKAKTVDEDATPLVVVKSPDEADATDKQSTDATLSEKKQAQRDIQKLMASAGGDTDEGAASLAKYLSGAQKSGSAASGAGAGVGKSTFSGMEGEESAEAGSNASKEKSSSNGSGSGKSGSTNGNSTGTGTGTDKTSEGHSMDAQGEYTTLPTDVGHVAACGEYAAAVCMVAGADCLSASSKDFVKGCASISAWRDAEDASVVFSEDGTLLSTGAAKLVELHNARACDVVVVTNESQLGSGLSTLKNAGIDVVVASMATLDNIQFTVKALGKMFSEKTNGASSSVASQYGDFCTSVISQCKGKANCYTTYVSDWDEEAAWEITSGNMTLAKGKGAAATQTNGASVVTDCLEKVGVTNVPGTDAYNGMNGGLYWLSQYSKTVGTYTVTGSSKYSGVGYSNKSSNPTRLFTIVDPTDPDGTLLGKAGYKTLIAGNADVAKGLINSRDNSGFYAPCDMLPVRVSAKKGVGLYADDYHYALSYIGDGQTTGSDCYKVYTAPHGLYSSWTEGSVESVLLVAWAAQKYNDKDSLESLTKSFYKTFYDVDLSATQYASITKSAGE